jgi:hypothetical protein
VIVREDGTTIDERVTRYAALLLDTCLGRVGPESGA